MIGPFHNQKDKDGKGGLVWIGVPERCDRCKGEYPMSWITFNGKQFLCAACDADDNYPVDKSQKQEDASFDFMEECDCCHDIFPISEMTIDKSGNNLLCKKCGRGDTVIGEEGPYDKYFQD